MTNSLGMIEVLSIPVGIEAADAMLKAGTVELRAAHSVCAGKYIAIVVGDVAAVRSAVKAGVEVAGMKLIDSLVIPSVDPQVAPAINACTEAHYIRAVGSIETYSLCAAVEAADEAVKAADIILLEIRLGRGLGGKSFITMTGEVAAVKASIAKVQGIKEIQGLLSDCVVIPAPHPELAKVLL